MHRWIAALAFGIGGIGLAACTNQLPTFLEEGEILAIEINNSCRAIEQGATCTMRASAFTEGGIELDDPLLFWSTSSPQILAVETPAGERTLGIVQGVSGGVATVTVTNAEQTVTSQTSVRVQQPNTPPGEECQGGPDCL